MKHIKNHIRSALKLIKTKESQKQEFKLSKLKRLFPYIKKHWKKAVSASILMIIISLFALPIPLLMKYVIDDIIPKKLFGHLSIVVLLLFGIQITKLVLSFLTNYIFNILNQEILLTIKKNLFGKIIRLPFSFFDSNQTGYIMSRIGEVNSLNIFFSSSMARIFIAFFEFIFCLFVLFYMHWKLAFVSILILPVYYFVSKFYSQGIRKASRDLFEKGAILSKQFQESISGVEVIKTYATEERETEKINHNLENLKQSSITTNIIHSFSSELLGLIGAIGGFIVLWYSGYEIMRENFTIGGYIAFTAYLAKLYGPTQIMATMSLTLQPAASALNRVLELFDLTSHEENENRTIRLSKLDGKIEFIDISFSYDSLKKDVLKKMSFKINPGETIAIVGPNGSGKSTILKLLLGLYQNRTGRILIDDININKIDLSTLRERISTISQNVFLFNDSIKNNIGYSNLEATDKEIIDAAKQAGAFDFIMNLDKGFDTIIGELGKKLSGGEKQKLSVARAILKNSDIILFDEAVSQLDEESVKKHLDLLNNHFSNKTCIIVMHNLPDKLRLDKIFKLKNGELMKVSIYGSSPI